MKLILAENEEEIKIFYKKFGKSEGFKWIVLSLFAIPELEKLNINCDVIDNYYDKKELWNATGWNSYERVNELIKFVDNFIKTNIEAFKDIDVLNCYKHQLIMLFDGIIGRIFMLKSLLEKLKPIQIYICKREPQVFSGYGYLFNQNDTLWANCLFLKGWHREISFIASYKIVTENLPSKKFALKNLLKKNSLLFKLIKEYRTFQKWGVKNYIKKKISKKRILLLTYGYEWKNTTPIFLKNNLKVETKSVDEIRKTESENTLFSEAEVLINKLNKKNEYKEKFAFENIDFYPLLKSRIEKMVYEGITKGFSIYKKATEYVQKFRPEAVLFAIASCSEYWFFLQSFKKDGIPIICWQHGSEGFYDNRGTPETELLYTNYFFSYGKGIVETYLKFKKEYNFQPIPVGSPSLDKLGSAKGILNGHILYTTTNYYQNNLYFGIYPPPSDTRLYSIQKKMLNYLEKIKNEKVIFKLHPSLSYRTPPIKLNSSNIKIIRNEKGFTELLRESKTVILDWPSTTLLQSAVTDKPIFVLTNLIKLKAEASELLKKRVVCAETPEELIKKLDNYLKTGNYPADVNNREFIKEYGTYLDDGKSAERAVNKVLEIIKENVNQYN